MTGWSHIIAPLLLLHCCLVSFVSEMGKNVGNGSSQSSDPRFAAMSSAPIFKKAKHKNQKVKVDDRFKKVLTDERFRANVGKVDKYGRKKAHESNKNEAIKELQEFYDIEDDVEEEADDDQEENETPTAAAGGNDTLSRLDYLTKLSRGELDAESDSDSESDSSRSDSDAETDDDDDDKAAAGTAKRVSALAVAEDEPLEETQEEVVSNRLAIQNCDWESVTAQDLMVILQSFCPGGKAVKSVSIYPSDFGLQAMAQEAKYGPQNIWKTANPSNTSASGAESADSESENESEEEEEQEESDAASEESEESGDDDDDDDESSEASKTESELAREQQENDEALEDIYNELKGEKKKQLTVKQLQQWDDVQGLLSQEIITEEDLLNMIRDVLSDGDDADADVKVTGSTKLSLDQFKAVVAMLDEAEVELGAAADLEEQEEGEGEDQSDPEEDDNDDLYDGIEPVSGSEGEGSEEGSEGEGSDADDQEADGHRRKSKKSHHHEDFRRRKGAVGLVMEEDLLERGKSRDNKQQQLQTNNKASNNGTDFDEVALRRYELSKLRYYFAVVECDDAETANSLYSQLDSIELENTSMVFDMRLIPQDVSFEGRTVREQCRAVPQSYKPPEFVINALQHTKVQCSWDEGEKSRERKLTNISSWRNLNQSELQQYIASSDSEDDDDVSESESDSENDNRKKTGKKQSKKANSSSSSSGGKAKKADKASKLRSLLLGGSDSDEGHEDNQSEDDFFNSSSGAKKGKKAAVAAASDDENEDGEKWMTFMPEEDSKEGAAAPVNETPYEALRRKEAEKKKERKAANKQQQQSSSSAADAHSTATSTGAAAGGVGKVVKSRYVGKNGPLMAASEEETAEERARRHAQLELMFTSNEGDNGGDESGDETTALSRDRLTHDLRQLAKEEKKRANKLKKQQKGKKGTDGDDKTHASTAAAAVSEFHVNVKDDRFKDLFDGNAKFGIDMTSTEYRETAGVKEILSEQRKRREESLKNGNAEKPSKKSRSEEPSTAATATAAAAAAAAAVSGVDDVNSLANKLKKKFAGK